MKKSLKTFRVWIPTSFGIGCFEIKANSLVDAFNRLSKADKSKNGSIDDEDGTVPFSEIKNII